MTHRIALSVLTLLFLLTGCPSPAPVTPPATQAVPSVVLKFSNPSRTIGTPWSSLIQTYQVTFTHQGDGTVLTGSTAAGQTTLVVNGVYAGTWSLVAEGLDASGTVVARKSTSQVLPTAGTINLAVEPLPGVGGFSFKLRFLQPSLVSDKITAVQGQVYTLAGTTLGAPFSFVPGDFATDGAYQAVTFASTGLSQGAYRLGISLLRSGGVPARALSEAINISGAVTADRWIAADGTLQASRDLSLADFTSTSTSLGNLVLSTAGLGLASDGSPFVFTDTTAAYDLMAKSIDATQSLTFQPTIAMGGQTIESSVNGGSTWQKILSGTEGTQTLAAGSQTLKLRVTAADGLTKGVYEFTLTKTVLAASVTLVAPNGTSLATNEAKPLDVTFGNSPTDTSVVFSYSDPTVATVTWDTQTSRYWIFGQAVGTTTITATSPDGPQDSLLVTVTPGFQDLQTLNRGAWVKEASAPEGTIALAGNASFLYALTELGQIRRYQAGLWMPLMAVPATYQFLALAPGGILYAGEPTTGTVYRFTGVWEPLTGTLADLKGLAVDRDGQVYVADSGSLKVRAQGLWSTLGALPPGYQALGGGDAITALDSTLVAAGTLRTWEATRWLTTGPVPAGTTATTWAQGPKTLRQY